MAKLLFSEFLGIMLGDGNIYSNTKNGNHRIVITGDSSEDYNYLVGCVAPAIKTLFGFDASLWKHKNKNAIALAVYSKALVNKLLSYGLVSGPKTMEIPKFVLKNKKRLASFLRGISDTDFSVTFKKNKREKHSYPLITATFSNQIFVQELKSLLLKFNINSSVYEVSKLVRGKLYLEYQIDIYGEKNLYFWLENIGFNNPKHLTKIEVWKKFGSYSPNTTYKERLIILNEKTYKSI